MAHFLVTNTPIGGIDMDSEDYAMAPEDARDVLNIRNTYTYTNVERTATPLKGNVLIAYDLGGVKHKCIGSKTDKENRTIIYCLWAADGNHKILRWFPDKITTANPYGTIELVMQHSFDWEHTTSIHSSDVVGDLFYWVDPVPHKINLAKANLTNKFKTWKIILPKNYSIGVGIFQFVIKDYATNTSIVSENLATAGEASLAELFVSLADQINTGALKDYVTAEACDCSLKITEKKVNSYNLLITIPDYKVVPENFYGKTPLDRYFDAAKYPSAYQPNLSYEKNPDVGFNYVAKKVIQARTQYVFDDHEESVLSPISQIAINNLTCDGSSDDAFNFIRINFNDPLLTDPATWVLVKKVNVLVREHNTGDWKIVATQEACDYFNVIDSDPVCFYDFYADTDTYPVDPTLVAAQYDFIPQKANTQAVVDRNLTYSGVEDNFDVPDCVKAACTQDFEEDPKTKMYRIRLYIRIYTVGLSDAEDSVINGRYTSMFPGYFKSPFWLPGTDDETSAVIRGIIGHDISRTENNWPYFGGGGFGTGGGFDFGIRSGMEDKYDQRLPEGGFPVYLAGTPYLGVSKQISVGLPTDSQGALDTSTESYISAIGTYLGDDAGDLYSVVDIYAPPGEYVARVASHWCSFNDKLGLGDPYNLNHSTLYQKTSTNVWGCYSSGGGPYTPGSWQKTKEIRITVTDHDIDDAGTFVIMDLTPPWDATTSGETQDLWQPLNAYLYDSEGNTSINDDEWHGIPVEKTPVVYDEFSGWNAAQYTDHNGYFFGICSEGQLLSDQAVFQVLSAIGALTATSILNFGTLTDLINKTVVPITLNGLMAFPSPFINEGLMCGIICVNSADVRGSCSTVVEGDVVDADGNPVPGVTVVFENGQITQTDTTGHYDFIAWSDMLTQNLTNSDDPYSVTVDYGGTRTVDDLIFDLNIFCQPSYPDGQVVEDLNIDPIGTDPGDYNPSNHYVVDDFEIDEAFEPGTKRHKRGGKYKYVIRFADTQTRLSNLVDVFDVYVPFITEDLNKILPDQYPVAGTFRRGQPILNWEIDSTERPPVEAATYQFLRSRNLIYENELQWVINSVTYLYRIKTINDEELTTSYNNFDAVAVKLSLSNIIDYFASHPDSHIGYEFNEGDRIRFIADRGVNYFNELIEAEILSYDATTQSIIIKVDNLPSEIFSGTFVETYTPRKVTDKDGLTFVEVGEAFACTTPGVDGNDYSVKAGTFTNGDTYWRGRYIPVSDDVTNFAAAYPLLVEANDISDFWISQDEDMGRIAAKTDALRKIFRGNAIRVSNQYLPDTAINGLSTFRNISDKEIDINFGDIQRTVTAGYVFLVVCYNKCVSIYIGRTLVKAGPNDYLQANTDSILGDTRALQGEIGTQHPESVVEYNGYVYGVDAKRGICWRYAGDGINEISTQHKMRAFFAYYVRQGIWSIHGIVDKLYNEYIVTIFEKKSASGTSVNGVITLADPIDVAAGDFVEVQYTDPDTMEKLQTTVEVESVTGTHVTVYDTTINGDVLLYYRGEGKTLAWAETKNRFTTRYSYLPERMETCDKDYVTFKDGAMWIHDKNPIYNNFYGVQYKSSIQLVLNAAGQEVKAWLALMINSKQSDGGFNWSVPAITNKNGQSSYLLKDNFVKGEEYWHSDFKRDVNTLGVNFPILNGALLRNSALVVTLENDFTGEFDLRAINAAAMVSYRNTK